MVLNLRKQVRSTKFASHPQVRKAVFPVGGLGSRFLPATKASPKEMLPIVDKPLIQYAVDEAISAGITEMVFVTSASKRAIEDHFDTNFELEARLAQQGKNDILKIVRNILPKGVSCVYIRQPMPLGLGHAVWCAKKVICDEPFAVILADDLIDNDKKPCLKQMVEVFAEQKRSVLAIQKIDPKETKRYGIVKVRGDILAAPRVEDIVEKPNPQDAPSNLAVVGRYILTPGIFDYLDKFKIGAGGEIQLTDAIAHLLKKEKVFAHLFAGTRYDCGCKMGYLHATIAYALKHPELSHEFEEYLRHFGGKDNFNY